MKNTKKLISCVQPGGRFIYGIHKPQYRVSNLRERTKTDILGKDENGNTVDNRRNFPKEDITVAHADWIYEIPNPFSFRGRTFIDKVWADRVAEDVESICINDESDANNIASEDVRDLSVDKTGKTVSFSSLFTTSAESRKYIQKLPTAMQLALATTSTDSVDLITLAHISCELSKEKNGTVLLSYHNDGKKRRRAIIHDHLLFEAVANNPYLPDCYKIAMLIRPGVQGISEIVGEWRSQKSHIYEYLRRNSYIAGGHYAANMAEDAIRYSTLSLGEEDVCGLRHLYYQRTFVRLAKELSIAVPSKSRTLTSVELEKLRQAICQKIIAGRRCNLSATLWGWNYGFDYAPTGYRLHASHQQIHQQYAMMEGDVCAYQSGCNDSCGTINTYSCGDLIAATIEEYYEIYQSDFFSDYRKAIRNNKRMDSRNDCENGNSLVIWSDDNVMLFVPKAQTSQWEVQIMILPTREGELAGNIVECSIEMRDSLDRALLTAQKVLATLGAKMVTTIEFSKRIGSSLNQPLLYSLLPKLPESPGAFSEAQLRFINGHFPEDFAAACRAALKRLAIDP